MVLQVTEGSRLKVLMHQGASKGISQQLAGYDVVITTSNTLASDWKSGGALTRFATGHCA